MAPTNKNRAMPLHLAALYGKPIAVEILLKFNALVNKTTYGGHTSMHYAVFVACPETGTTILQFSEGLKVCKTDSKSLSQPKYAKEMCVNILNDLTRDERKMLIEPRHPGKIVGYREGFDVHGLRNEQQTYMDAANVIHVDTALITSITFSPWLNPPSGFSKHEEDYVAINKYVVGAFWVFSCIPFFSTIVSIVASVDSTLPKWLLSLKKTEVNMRGAVF